MAQSARLRGLPLTAATVRRLLHAIHALAVLLLLVTGVLLFFPELRGAAIGGYGQSILDLHLWGGAAFGLAPLAAAGLMAGALAEDVRRRLGPPDPWRWRKSHIVISLAASAGLVVSGIAIWFDDALPRVMGEPMHWIHDALTVVLAVALPVHLVASRRKIVSRVREWLGLAPPPPEPFDFEDEDE